MPLEVVAIMDKIPVVEPPVFVWSTSMLLLFPVMTPVIEWFAFPVWVVSISLELPLTVQLFTQPTTLHATLTSLDVPVTAKS